MDRENLDRAIMLRELLWKKWLKNVMSGKPKGIINDERRCILFDIFAPKRERQMPQVVSERKYMEMMEAEASDKEREPKKKKMKEVKERAPEKQVEENRTKKLIITISYDQFMNGEDLGLEELEKMEGVEMRIEDFDQVMDYGEPNEAEEATSMEDID